MGLADSWSLFQAPPGVHTLHLAMIYAPPSFYISSTDTCVEQAFAHVTEDMGYPEQMRRGCSVIVFRQALPFSDHSLKIKSLGYFFGPHNSPLDLDPVLMKQGPPCLVVLGEWRERGQHQGHLSSSPTQVPSYILLGSKQRLRPRYHLCLTPIPRGLQVKEEAYPLSVQ